VIRKSGLISQLAVLLFVQFVVSHPERLVVLLERLVEVIHFVIVAAIIYVRVD